MSDELSRDEFYRALHGISTALDSGFARVNERLDRINGRVGVHGEDIAVLKDRGVQDKTARGLSASSLLAGAGALLWQFLSKP